MVTEVAAVTAVVFTVKLALVAPAATVTLAGTVATAVFELDNVTTVPPAGAGALSVTVAVDVLPPVTLVGLSVKEATVTVVAAGGFTVSVADCVTPPADAEIVTGVVAVTAAVVTVKVALEVPAATVTLAGTEATPVLLLDSVTTVPPAGAGALRVTVPWEVLPPVTVAGLSVSDARAAAGGAPGSTQSVADMTENTTSFCVAVISTGVEEATEAVVIAKVTWVAPAGTVTLAGTAAAAALLLESVRSVPPAGAGVVSTMLPCAVPPPVTPLGARVRADISVGGGVPAVNDRVADHGLKLLTPSRVRTRQ